MTRNDAAVKIAPSATIFARTAPVMRCTTTPWPTPIISVLITKTAADTQPGNPSISTTYTGMATFRAAEVIA